VSVAAIETPVKGAKLNTASSNLTRRILILLYFSRSSHARTNRQRTPGRVDRSQPVGGKYSVSGENQRLAAAARQGFSILAANAAKTLAGKPPVAPGTCKS
jgi:hypothetical protein